MKDKFRYLPPNERKTILLLCDDIRMHSGIATMAREIVVKSAHHFNWFNLGAALQHPEAGKVMDLSQDINQREGIEGANVKVMPNNGYGDPMLIRKLLKDIKPDAVMIFTDPRYWTWLFDIEREIRTKIPIHYLNIWDDYPSPLWNKNFYNSVDTLMAISKQTLAMNKMVLREEADNKILKYVPHGIDDKVFHPIDKSDPKFVEFKTKLFEDKDIDFVAFYNSRNIHRKRPADVILSYRMFCDRIGKEKAKKCALVMHTNKRDDHGTDLGAVKEAFCDPEYVNVYFSEQKLAPEQMNLLYNLADVQLLISSNEGWGLSLTEAMMSGTMIIPNTTGGMQDQARFEDEDGNWIDFDDNFPSNHRGTYKKCGKWAVPVFPSNISVAGSPPTPYIYDDRCQPEDVAEALETVYNLDDRDERGLAGREWAMGDEAKMTAEKMVNTIIETIDEANEAFIPRPAWELHKITERPRKYVQHKLTGY
jgi:glycosyltransferase involved in cell wall biosynthesis